MVWVPKLKAAQSDKDSAELIQKDIDNLLDSSGAVSAPRVPHIGTDSSPAPPVSTLFFPQQTSQP
jgi:hypothetical protein